MTERAKGAIWTDAQVDDFCAAHRAVIEGDLGGYRDAVRAGLQNIGAVPLDTFLRERVEGLTGQQLNELASALSGRTYGVPHGSPKWLKAERELDDEKRAALLHILSKEGA